MIHLATVVSKDSFMKEFGDKGGKYAQMIDCEVGPEPVESVVTFDNMYLDTFATFLDDMGYRPHFLHWNKGEDLSRIKTYPSDEENNNQRHGKAWDTPEGIHTTWHNEKSAWKAIQTISGIMSHLSSGQGNYKSGTRDFLEELKPYGFMQKGDDVYICSF